ncbi:MAG: class I adenylate-forming enzyme family protein [Brevirhabdus sp.]
MLSTYDQGPPPPCPEPFNLAAYVLEAGQATPDKPALAIVDTGGVESLSYGALRAAVLGMGGALRARGLRAGDKVLLRLGNTVDFPIAYLGAIAAGIVPVPLAAALTPHELAPILDEIAPSAIFRDDRLELPETDLLIIGSEALAAMRDHAPCTPELGDPERLAYIVYTSGTSGKPRAVMHAHRAVWARRMMWQGWYGITPDDRVLHAGAFNWTFTLGTGLIDPWSVGATALIPAEGVDTAALPLLLERHEATIFAAAPGIFRKLLAGTPGLSLPTLRHALSAGEKLPPAIATGWQAETGTLVHEALGMSECSTFISASPARPAHPGHSGRPQQGRRVAVLDDAGQPVARNTPGVLAVHRDDPGLMLGYLGQPDETAARFRGDWFVTGDTVEMDEDGEITYLGRDDDMMNAGGFRVSPMEVEKAFHALEGIESCAAVAVDVREAVSVIALFYVAGHNFNGDVLEAFAARTLARYKQPRLYLPRPSLPLNANGKINRRALREIWNRERTSKP